MDPRRLVILGVTVAISAVIGLAAWWQRPASQPAPSAVSTPVSGQPAPQAPAAATAPAGTSEKAASPSFDIARVEPNGDAVLAGRAAPGSEVELLSNGVVIDRAKANEAGEFVLSPPPFAPGNYELTLRSGGVPSAKSVTVSIPAPGTGGDVLVVAGEPGQPSQIVAAGPAAPGGVEAEQVAMPGQPVSNLSDTLQIAAVEAEGGRLFVQGTGPAGVRVVIYLNNQPIAEATVGADKTWSLTVERGLDQGNYAVRVDQIAEGGKVTARAEVPFSSGPSKPGTPAPPSAPANATAQAETAPSAETQAPAANSSDAESGRVPAAPKGGENAVGAPSASNIVVGALNTLRVQRGDNLWRISRRTYGRGVRYSTIYKANTGQIRNPNRIYPGQIFVMPARP